MTARDGAAPGQAAAVASHHARLASFWNRDGRDIADLNLPAEDDWWTALTPAQQQDEIAGAQAAVATAAAAQPAATMFATEALVRFADAGQWLTCTEDGRLDLRAELLAVKRAVREVLDAAARPGEVAAQPAPFPRLTLGLCGDHPGQVHAQILDEPEPGLRSWVCLRAVADIAEGSAPGPIASASAAPGLLPPRAPGSVYTPDGKYELPRLAPVVTGYGPTADAIRAEVDTDNAKDRLIAKLHSDVDSLRVNVERLRGLLNEARIAEPAPGITVEALTAALDGRRILAIEDTSYLRIDDGLWAVTPARPRDLAEQLLTAISARLTDDGKQAL